MLIRRYGPILKSCRPEKRARNAETEMERWDNFFLGELGAAAALAGLLFVSVSVNQAKILEMGRMADRAIEALAMLFLVIAIASLALTPAQPPRLFGAEVSALTLLLLVVAIPLQRGYLRAADPVYRPHTLRMAWGNRIAMATALVAGLALFLRSDWTCLYLLVPSILLIFIAVGVNAWVLLVEINR
jgi:hypothetical protein